MRVLTFIFVIILLVVVAWVVRVVSLPLRSATGVAERVMNPDALLAHYRWLKDASEKLEVYPAQIAVAKDNLAYAEKNDKDRASARYTELTGIRQVCMDLVAQYNARTNRLDSKFLRNPDRYLPVVRDGYRPLPETYDTKGCE